MKKGNLLLLTVIAAIFIFAIISLVYPLFGREGMRLGLDLSGGVYLEYEVEYPEGTSASDQSALMNKALAVIRSRIDRYGVAEPLVQSLGNERIIVQLPGFGDVDQAKNLVEQTGFLEFREVELNSSGSPVYLRDYLNQTELAFIDAEESGERYFVGSDNQLEAILQMKDGNLDFIDASGTVIDTATLKEGNTEMVSWIAARGDDGVQLTGSLLSDAAGEISQNVGSSTAVVAIKWNSQGSTVFDNVAKRLYSRPSDTIQRDLGIFLDKNLISAPQIKQQQYGGSAVIEGSFTLQEAQDMAAMLNSGSLPIPLQKPPIYEETVSATLGADFTKMAVVAGIVATLLIMIFMISYYRIPGVMSSLSLIFYGAVSMAVFKLWPVTLSLAGIGGFVLSIGMAVDANVLNFERLKEEIRAGRTVGAAIEAGFDRAWAAIRDSNITTIISAVILYWVGGMVPNGEPLKGFAVTVLVGTVVGVFSTVIVTRSLLRLFSGTRISQKTSLFSAFTGRK